MVRFPVFPPLSCIFSKYCTFRPAAFTTLARLFREPQHLTRSTEESGNAAGIITEIDYEEQMAGYQVAYARLAASESAIDVDPVAYVPDPRTFLEQELRRLSLVDPARVRNLLAACDPEAVNALGVAL
jgi:exportin-2 (importin alpha re-exporter)